MNQRLLTYGLVFCSLLIIGAIYFDGFWHISIGRESFFIPPHIALYSSLLFLVFLLYKAKADIPRIAWLFVALILLAAPFDNWWHNRFGVEALTSLLVVWSPPHVVAELSLLALLLIILRQLFSETKGFALTLQWAAITALALFTLSPLDLLGPYRVFGVWGGLVNLFAVSFFVHTYLKLSRKPLWSYLVVTLLISIPISLHEGVAAGFAVFHAHLAVVLLVLLFLLPSIIVDLVGKRRSDLFKTSLFLLLYVVIFQGGHLILIEGYRELWYGVLVYALFSYPLVLLASKVSTGLCKAVNNGKRCGNRLETSEVKQR